MEAFIIISISLTVCLCIERIIKHINKSSCCGNSIEFNKDASILDFSKIPLSK